MITPTPTPDRRRRRSHDPSTALYYQLDACRRSAGLDALLLSDRDGLCIAAAGDGESCDEFAARISIMHPGRHRFEGELWTDVDRWDVHVCRFELDGFEMSLCAVGGLADDRASQVDRSLRGVARILAA
ncbi:hypothetical protein [Haliangium sp.]|uniref:hypothetical protein n=1 Tax=Haliangium sp. TaxID=2663208 RepID=UPI003D0E6FDF